MVAIDPRSCILAYLMYKDSQHPNPLKGVRNPNLSLFLHLVLHSRLRENIINEQPFQFSASGDEGISGGSLYSQRGVSAQKEEVHSATKNLDKGLYPNAFCKLFPDTLGGDENCVNVMHADGAGTKSVLAYLYWKETGDVSLWKGIAQDAIVMNLDDLLCTGIYDNLLFSSTIDRNKKLIPGECLKRSLPGARNSLTS